MFTNLSGLVRTVLLLLPASVLANGGPFVIKYPKGDPSSKGVLARLDPSLMPVKETRLKVVRESLVVEAQDGAVLKGDRGVEAPLFIVTAEYEIKNGTREPVIMDFGFPILGGFFIESQAMSYIPDVGVTVDGNEHKAYPIFNSAIYGFIRQRGRQAIDRKLQGDPKLWPLTNNLRQVLGRAQAGTPAERRRKTVYALQSEVASARAALRKELVERRAWSEAEASLLVEWVSLPLGGVPRSGHSSPEMPFDGLAGANLGPLSAIGEQKATQLFATLAGKLDGPLSTSYEKIFAAWGGDVLEKALDLSSGKVRPREISVARRAGGDSTDPTVYSRVRYLDEQRQLSADHKASCEAILKNLPVVFTFAPMSLLYYRVNFKAGQTRQVKVRYAQHGYVDSKSPATYQLAYYLHPATLWQEFGPIELTVRLPATVKPVASVPLVRRPAVARDNDDVRRLAAHVARLERAVDKRGRLFIAIKQAEWLAARKHASAEVP